MAVQYAIGSLDEARAYLKNNYLRGHLLEICEALLALGGNDPVMVMGSHIDALKLCSSMTLFRCADSSIPVFAQVLKKYYGGWEDRMTLAKLGL